jgi:hypothetical protein
MVSIDILRDRSLGTGVVALLALLLAIGCSPDQPSPSVSPTPATTQAPLPSESMSSPTLVAIELHSLDPRYVPGGALRSANGQLIWSAGSGGSRELWRYVPGAEEPEQLFVSPREDGAIVEVVASEAGYAFVETSPSAFGEGGWRVWLLGPDGGEAIEIGRGRAPGAGSAPTIAMDERHVVWTGFDEPQGGPVSKLQVVRLDDPSEMVTILELPIADSLLWYPALHGSDVWYGTIKAGAGEGGDGDEFHIEILSITAPNAPPKRFEGIANDFNPAVDDRYVAWKTVEPGFAALNWGTLHVLDRQSQEVTEVPVPEANRPSLGDRFLAFQEITHRRLEVFDLERRELVDLLTDAEDDDLAYGGQTLSGNLLGFFSQGTGFPQIRWAELPS